MTFFRNKNKISTRFINQCLSLSECLAKTYNDDTGINHPGRDVFSHCLIVGEVARSLLSRMPKWLIQDLYPEGTELISAVHDVGKASPTFQEKIRRGRNNSSDYCHNSHPGLKDVDPEHEKRWGGHAGVSQLAVKHYQAGKYIPEIIGQHHGCSPKVEGLLAEDSCFGGKNWQRLREELIEKLKAELKANWPTVVSDKQARLLAGLTTVSDWIGSASVFDDPQNTQWKTDIENSLNNAGFFTFDVRKGLSFEDVFKCTPRPAQQTLFNACSERGVYILEAPMGIGKTEAALYASYKIMETGKATGIYFALPTQLTSDKIYERINRFLEQILSSSSSHTKAILSHANAKLKMTEIGVEGSPGGSWFSASKRELLAPFGVGTIDQALMSVLNVKHGFVRAFGLAGKVVILDEIHSYDAYTGTIIDTLIENLLAWKCTVIILSATLTAERRRALLKLPHGKLENYYPLISISSETQFSEVPITPDEDVGIAIHMCCQDAAAIDEALARAERGQQILWIENTVQEAQDVYRLIAARASECDVKCGLLHSRFTRAHREKIEAEWIGLYGKEGAEERLKQGRILVGTQILEQSLDIDSDFLVSRVCPTDMMLQRMGRLWRHKGTIRASSAEREAWILSPRLELAFEDAKTAFGKTSYVYSPYYLIRSLEVLSSCVDMSISLPSQMRGLIESTYENKEDSGLMRKLKRDLEERRGTLKRLAGLGLSREGTTLTDENVTTRYSEQDSCDVLIVKKVQKQDRGTSLTLSSGEELFLPKSSSNLKERRELSVALQKSIVRVAQYQAPDSLPKNDLSWIKDYLYVGSEEDSLLRIAKQMPGDELVSLEDIPFSQKTRNYNSVLGYWVDE